MYRKCKYIEGDRKTKADGCDRDNGVVCNCVARGPIFLRVPFQDQKLFLSHNLLNVFLYKYYTF